MAANLQYSYFVFRLFFFFNYSEAIIFTPYAEIKQTCNTILNETNMCESRGFGNLCNSRLK